MEGADVGDTGSPPSRLLALDPGVGVDPSLGTELEEIERKDLMAP